MFIQLTDRGGNPVWVNVSQVLTFLSSHQGTKLYFINTDTWVVEEPYKVWAKIRAEENAQRDRECTR